MVFRPSTEPRWTAGISGTSFAFVKPRDGLGDRCPDAVARIHQAKKILRRGHDLESCWARDRP